jgi:hypothetical protein
VSSAVQINRKLEARTSPVRAFDPEFGSGSFANAICVAAYILVADFMIIEVR